MQVLNYIISTAVGIKTDDNNRKIDLPEKIHDIDIAAGYIPEGVSVGRFSPFRVGLKTPISVNLKSPMHHVCY